MPSWAQSRRRARSSLRSVHTRNPVLDWSTPGILALDWSTQAISRCASDFQRSFLTRVACDDFLGQVWLSWFQLQDPTTAEKIQRFLAQRRDGASFLII